MATSPVNADMSSANWSDDPVTLKEAVKMKRFPCIVKPCTLDCLTGAVFDSNLPKGQTLLIQEQTKLQLARVRVAELLSKNDAKHEYGMETVLKHEACLGDEFYIPLGVTCPLSLCQGARKYSKVSQINEDMPTSLTIDEDIMTVLSVGDPRARLLEKGTVLHLLNSQVYNGRTYFVFKEEGGNEVILNSDLKVNMTSVSDSRRLTLREMVESSPLPKLVQFLNIDDDEIVHADPSRTSYLKASLIGTLSVLDIKTMEFYLACVKHERDTDKMTNFANVLIPSELGEKERVYVKHFVNKDRCQRYIDRNFRGCADHQYVFTSMYRVPLEGAVTTVMNPAAKQEVTGTDSSNSDDDYIVPDPKELCDSPPPIPDRLSTRAVPNRSPATDDVGVESEGSSPLSPAPVQVPIQLKTKTRHKYFQSILDKLKIKITHSSKRRYSDDSQSESSPLQSPAQCHDSDSHEDTDGDPEDYLEPIERRAPAPTPPGLANQPPDYRQQEQWRKQQTANREGRWMMPACQVEELRPLSPPTSPTPPCRPLRPQHQGPFWSAHEGSFGEEDSGNGEEIEDFPLPIYHYACPEMLTDEAIARQGQTGEDFRKYSVTDVVKCLRMCGMEPFAKLCNEHTLDGEFIIELNEQDLQESPFNLGKVELCKLNKIIHKGWRPRR